MFKKFARFYNHILNRYTYPVQMASAGTLWLAGDVLCQSLVWYTNHNPDGNTQKEPESLFHVIDWTRSIRMTIYGTLFSAPIYTCWFVFLDKFSSRIFISYPNNVIPAKLLKTPSHPPASKISHATSRLWKITAFKTTLDVIIFDPFYLTFFFIVTGLMENKPPSAIKEKVYNELPTTFAADVAVWLPIQFANFRYIPVLYQPLIVQGVNLFWNSFLSWVQHKDSTARSLCLLKSYLSKK